MDHAAQPPRTDHFPILSTIDISPPRSNFEPRRNFRKVDWQKFYNKLQEKLDVLPPPCEIETKEQVHGTLEELDQIVQDVIELYVPWTKPSPYIKRWWTDELSVLRKHLRTVQKKAYRVQMFSDHPIHEEKRQIRKAYVEAMDATKTRCWMEWLENAGGSSIWEICSFISQPTSDGGRSRIPDLVVKQDTQPLCRV